jgi:uncharacterized membrane protein YeaQ/YmgE (transglycosylase-associated protein family)
MGATAVTVENIIVWFVVGVVGGWIGKKLIGGHLLVLLPVYISAAIICGFILPSLGFHVGAGLTVESIINSLLGTLLLGLPLYLMLRPNASTVTSTTKQPEHATNEMGFIGRLTSGTVGKAKKFISCRRDDSRDVTGRLYDGLINEFRRRKRFQRLGCNTDWCGF